MTTDLERPKAPLSFVVVGVAVAALVGLLVLRTIVGFVFTITKIGIAIAIVAAIVMVISRATSDDS